MAGLSAQLSLVAIVNNIHVKCFFLQSGLETYHYYGKPLKTGEEFNVHSHDCQQISILLIGLDLFLLSKLSL